MKLMALYVKRNPNNYWLFSFFVTNIFRWFKLYFVPFLLFWIACRQTMFATVGLLDLEFFFFCCDKIMSGHHSVQDVAGSIFITNMMLYFKTLFCKISSTNHIMVARHQKLSLFCHFSSYVQCPLQTKFLIFQ